MTIGRFAAEAGVGVETVRYYQRRGLLPVPRAAGSYREYDAELLRRLRFIRQVQAAGFTLEEIRELIRLDRTGDRPRIQTIAARKLEELRGRMRGLRAVAKVLEALVHDCRHAPAGTPCPIIEAFDVGGGAESARQIRRR
ncbi:MAG TPA: MerR family transcriptional regulator [Burkholderiales bacterium]|nr:MerR family transcriptional regulator [Burkholderiales bacterium]